MKRRAFTMVELLMVIAIIGLLLSFLLPTLSKVKEEGYRIKCMNNLRQLGGAIYMYAQENRGQMVFCNWNWQEGAGRPAGWLAQSSSGNSDPAAVETSAIWQYFKLRAIYRCVKDKPPFAYGGTQNMTSYGMNGAVNGFGASTTTYPGYPVYSAAKFPGNGILLWEVSDANGWWNDGANYPWEGITDRHGTKGAGVLCFDGHTEIITQDEYAAECNKSPSRLWCNPGSSDGH